MAGPRPLERVFHEIVPIAFVVGGLIWLARRTGEVREVEQLGGTVTRSRADYPTIPASAWRAPAAVQTRLRQGLAWHRRGHSGRGLVPATVAWATRLSRGEPISPGKARKMRAWLARHASDLNAPAAKPGHPEYPSPGRVAWELWGGTQAGPWVARLVREMDAYDAAQGRARARSS
jgi:hypothetical protein